MKELSFEQALQRLEKIAEELESEDVSLDVYIVPSRMADIVSSGFHLY